MAIGASPKTFLSTGRRDPRNGALHLAPEDLQRDLAVCVAASILLRVVARWWGPHLADLLAWTGR
jgi:hypothetical protein